MKKTIFAFLIAFSGSVLLSMAQSPQAHHRMGQGRMGQDKDPKQAEVAIAKHVAQMKVRLSLTDKQVAQMTEILTKAQADRVALAKQQQERLIKERQEMKAKMNTQKAQIEALLTPLQKEELAKLKTQGHGRGDLRHGASHNGHKATMAHDRGIKKPQVCGCRCACQGVPDYRSAGRGVPSMKATPTGAVTK